MNPLISLIWIVPLVGFYLWMFRDMAYNATLSSSERYYWTMAFILLNVFAAAYYYVNVYRNGR